MTRWIGRNQAPYLHGPETEAVAEALASGQYGHNDLTEMFEQALADFLGVPDVVAVASGTAALHIALVAAGIGPGDEVVVPSMTFCATVQAIVAAGAIPRFCEVNPTTLCAGPEQIREALTERTRAVLPVLYSGRPVHLAPIRAELDAHGITVLLDAAHAFGSRQNGALVGATGDRTAFSFGPIKNLTCGQGGAIITPDPEEAERARQMRLLGVCEDATRRSQTTGYTVARHGYRSPLSSINAAIGLVQLEHFAVAEALRINLWTAYRDALATVADVTLVDVDISQAVPSMCVIRVSDRDQVFQRLRTAGVGVGVHYPPNHAQPAFARWRRPLPVTEQIAGELISLPFHPHLDGAAVLQVVEALDGALHPARGRR